MPTEQPLLTIAIPTYNRSKYLRQLLTVLTPQLLDMSNVELIISDNASPDDTPEVIQEFIQQGLRVRYIRNKENIGADANFLLCYNQASGDYLWIVGDDDVIVPGGLKRVLRVLEERQYDLIHIQAYGFLGEYAPPKEPAFKGKCIFFKDATDFALRIHIGFTFISGNIVKKKKIEANPHSDFSQIVGTNLVQLSWVFTLLLDNPKCIFLKDYLVASKMENSGGHGTSEVFGKNLNSIVVRFFGVKSDMGSAMLNRTIQSWLPWAMVQGRCIKNGQHFHEDSESILKSVYGSNFRYWVFLWPSLKLPLPLAKGWIFLIKITNRLDRVLGYPIAKWVR